MATWAQQKIFLADSYSLGKPRITLFVCLTTWAGFYLASTNGVALLPMLYTCIATYLVSFGSCVFNQVLEVQSDKKMQRTKKRPLPDQRLSKTFASVLGMVTTLGGLLLMWLAVNPYAAFWLLMAWVGYVLVYTPLKARTSLNTIVGAFVGALPPVVGWVAARGRISFEAIVLFFILFFWQLPHFLSIAWMYREDYKIADFKMITGIDPAGEITPRQAFLYTIMLFPVVMLPFVFSVAGGFYLVGSMVLTGLLARSVWTFWNQTNIQKAKRVLLMSVIYLPAIFILLVIDKVS